MEEINIDKDLIHKLYIAYGSNLNLNQMNLVRFKNLQEMNQRHSHGWSL